jgi:hypothetical protein
MLGVFGALCGAVFVGGKLLGGWWTYLGARFSTLAHGAAGDPNSMVRLSLYAEASQTIRQSGLLLGVAMTGAAAATSGTYYLDSYWASALVDLGWLGVGVIAAVAVVALVQAVAAALRAEGDSAVLGLAVLCGLLAAVALSFSGAWLAFAVVGGTFLLALPDVQLRPDLSRARASERGRARAD